MYQGHREESRAKNAKLPYQPERLSAIVLSHAHIDHAGRLPFLTRNGYTGTIWATAATRDLCAVMLADSAHIQEKDAEYMRRRGRGVVEPLYEQADIAPLMNQMVGEPYGRTFAVAPGVRATFVDAGHILGSASVVLECTEGGSTRRLIFAGDIGRWGQPIIRDPQPPSGGANLVIMESTYGDRDHPPIEDMRHRLAAIVRETAAQGGRILIPAFAVGRTQEIVYDLHALAHAGEIPSIPIYIDSPLAVDATSVFGMHPEIFDRTEGLVQMVQDLFRFELVHYTRDVADSKALNLQRGPDGHHLRLRDGGSGADSPSPQQRRVRSAEHDSDRRLSGGAHPGSPHRGASAPRCGSSATTCPLRARVEVLNGYSAHGDRTELTRWLDAVIDIA